MRYLVLKRTTTERWLRTKVCQSRRYALHELGLSHLEVVGIGDVENDHSFLERCECAVAVAKAVTSIKQIAALMTVA